MVTIDEKLSALPPMVAALFCAALLATAVLHPRAAAQSTKPGGLYGPPQPICEIADGRLDEISGIVASPRTPGCYWMLEDSGNPAEVYLVDRQGRTRLTVRLVNATNQDWEAIALAPGAKPGTFDICVADIGDNLEQRPEVVFYRFAEPMLGERDRTVVDVTTTVCRARYADGPVNAEAFAVHPRTGAGYIFAKHGDAGSAVFKLAAPWDAANVAVLPKVATLKLPDAVRLATVISGADISPDGRRLATRSYLCGWEWSLPAGAAAKEFEAIFRTEPARLTLASEPQGEAICYSADGRALLTVSEKQPTLLYEVLAQPPTDK